MSTVISTLPERIETEVQLDDVLTRPRPVLIEFIRQVRSPLVVLGAGGKMGPTLARLARRAADEARYPLEVIAVSRFSDTRARQQLEAHGVQTASVDLLDPEAPARLPHAGDVIYLVGLKFGTSRDPAATWAVNTLVPAAAARRYPGCRIVALSTGNVYPLTPVSRGGSVEADALTPLGEYANAAVARERVFEFVARQHSTPLVLLRLNYALELRYGVLVDIGRQVQAGAAVDAAMGHLNCMWQGDANEYIIRSLALAQTPARALNLTGLDTLSVRQLAERLGELLGRPAQVVGREAETALLSNPARMAELLGPPPTPLDAMLRWTAHWLQKGGRLLDRPTHFEVRDGQF
jgi:nucleoside-diphosphate-sugar epimerase